MIAYCRMIASSMRPCVTYTQTCLAWFWFLLVRKSCINKENGSKESCKHLNTIKEPSHSCLLIHFVFCFDIMKQGWVCIYIIINIHA
ncbi:hypothetical protein MtrunA17_Chr3g0144961 [Medicago truncatula]|uniref:Uncharacterized protein n=1 Tax=Medicago truncatula TaxID=3880 RepID=A0A396J0I9_MEDTR|nr:hypothetical protein MtrunA17_Chr3g0144961 [Medicago truncatula]